ncbi:MAG: hypothetical protein AAGB04_00575 [Pseudomonadota bacterium]
MTLRKKRKQPTGQESALAKGRCQHPELPLLSSLGFEEIDILILEILRSLCAGYEQDNLACWERAFDVAEEHLGSVDGPSFVSRCVMLLRALRAERAGGFCYMSTECIHISEAEQDLMKLVRVGSSAATCDKQVADAARVLATTADPSKLVTAARALGAMCIRHKRLKELESQTFTTPSVRLH